MYIKKKNPKQPWKYLDLSLLANPLVKNIVVHMPNNVIIIDFHGFLVNIWGSGLVRGDDCRNSIFLQGWREELAEFSLIKGSASVVLVPVWHKLSVFSFADKRKNYNQLLQV